MNVSPFNYLHFETERENVELGLRAEVYRDYSYKMADPELCDHIDHDTLNNRRSNLRIATRQENTLNRRLRSDNKLKLKGVQRIRGRFRGRVYVNGKCIDLGYFSTPKEAHEAYCEAAKYHHGEFARTI